ncbi:MAG: phosphopyruvate hydratase, partial [Lachnospiraceae bacterium]|nr:phosphopyruvate hydratase [Lachnospiraceae bacterium]
KILIDTDGTENKEKLGANATLSVSMAVARAAAAALHMPLFRYLGGISAKRMPVPMMNILNGGKHADNTVDFQEFMIMPVAAKNFAEGLRICAEVYQKLKQILVKDGLSTAVGDEGGFAPSLKNPEEVLDYIIKAVLAAGYQPEKDIKIALDVAASELYQEDAGMYYFPGETKALHSSKREAVSASDTKESSVLRSTDEMIALYEELCEKYPIASIEDGLHEDDWDGWRKLTQRLGDKIQLVGDDLFVTNTGRLAAGIRLHTANAILVKVNQIGTLSEAFAAIEMAHKSGYNAVISHRSGETEDTIIADIAVAVNAGQIKTGAPCRTDRVCKYNQLLRIEEELEDVSLYENPFSEKRGGM